MTASGHRPHLLIAGHGYLGDALRTQALAAGWEVTSIARTASDDVLACDLTDAAALRALNISPTHFVHCASSGKSGDAERYRAIYLGGIRNLCRTFSSARPYFVSSTSVYGQRDGSVVTEKSCTEPQKESSEILLEAEAAATDFGGAAVRLAGIYGPDRCFTIKRLVEGRAGIEGDGSRMTNHIHRDDAASAILHLIGQNAAGVYNVADDTPISQADLYGSLCQTLDLPIPPTIEPRLNSTRGWTSKAVSNAKLRATGWQPAFPALTAAAVDIAPTLGI